MEDVKEPLKELWKALKAATPQPSRPSMWGAFAFAIAAAIAGVPRLEVTILFVASVAWVEWRRFLWDREHK